MANRRRNLAGVGIIVVVIVVFGAAYLRIGEIMYDELGSIQGHCVDTDGPRWEGVTPANLAYSQQDLSASVPPLDTTPYRMADFQDVSFPSRADRSGGAVRIAAWWVPSPEVNAPAVVVVHGLKACRRDWNVLIPAGMLHRAGLSVLAIDLRNHGDSGKTDGHFYGGVLEKLDVLGAIDWLVQVQRVAPNDVGLLGLSLGAATVMLAAADDPQVPAVWEDSGYADAEQRTIEYIDADVHHYPFSSLIAPAGGIVSILRSGADIYKETPLSTIGRLKGRALEIVHGAANSDTDVHHAFDLFKAARQADVNAQLWVVPNAEHTREMLVDPVEYEQRLDGFFRTYLQSGT